MKNAQTGLEVAAVPPKAPALLPPPAALPPFIAQAGPKARARFVEFLTARIRNPNTRDAYARDLARFCAWCESRRVALKKLKPVVIAAYVEELGEELSAPTVKRHLSAIRMLCDWFVLGQVLVMNPAASVRGPKHVIKKGTTPILGRDELRQLFGAIETTTLVGLRDRALIAVMLFTFARVSAAVGLKVSDYRGPGSGERLRLREKGGKQHDVPVTRELARYLEEFLKVAQLPQDGPLFPALAGRTGKWSGRAMSRIDAFRMIKRRCHAAGVSPEIACHSFRGSGITAYLAAGGTIDRARAIAAHESAETTKLYDRTNDAITAEELERVTLLG